MSHEVRSMAYTGEMPWHGLGEHRPGATWDELMDLTWPTYRDGLHKLQLPEVIKTEDGSEVKLIQPAYVIADLALREGLGIVGKVFEPVQPGEFLEFVKALEIEPETMIRLFGGAVLVACGRAPECDFILGGDHGKVEAWLFVSNGFNGSRRFVAAATPIKVVCANTERAALSIAEDKEQTGFSYATKNTTNIHERLKVAADQMAEAKRYFQTFREVAEELQSQPFSEELMLEFASELFETELGELRACRYRIDAESTMEEVRQVIGASKESMDRSKANRLRSGARLVELFHSGKGCSGRTKMDAYSALTEYLDHERRYRKRESRFATIGLASHPIKNRGMKLLRRRAV